MKKVLSLFLALLLLSYAVTSQAQYPDKPITVYHPFEPTPYDVLSHAYNKEMEKILNVPFVFEYGMMGKAARAILDGAPDGQNIYFAAMGPMVLMPNMLRPAYAPDDFKSIGRATLLPIIVVARKDAPFKTFLDFIAYAKANPGKSSIGLTNFPSSLHIGMTHFIKDLAKIDVKLIEQPDGPMRGTIDCLIGETDMLISHPPDIMPYIKRGDFVPLVTFHGTRLEMLPEVPTLKELGYNFEQTSWRMLVVNKNTPQAIVETLAKASEQALKSTTVQRIAKDNYEIIDWLPTAEADLFLKKEFNYYRELSISLGLHHSQKAKK